MTKTKLNELVLAACKEHGASDELTNVLNGLTEPKSGGSANVNDYTVFDADNNPIFVLCNLHKKWEPVTNEDGEAVFKTDEKSKNGLFRDCNEGITQFRLIAKTIKASEAAIMTDLLDEAISGSDAKEQIAALGDVRSQIPAREDGLGTEERPEV